MFRRRQRGRQKSNFVELLALHFFVHFFAVNVRFREVKLISRFMEDVKTDDDELSFLFLNFDVTGSKGVQRQESSCLAMFDKERELV